MEIDVSTVIAVCALAVSIMSVYVTRYLWLQSNRPVVTAFVSEHASGNKATTFNLVVANTGNRPATNVRLQAELDDIKKLIQPDAEEARKEEVYRCFREESALPVVRNGEELATSFGAYSTYPNNGPWLNYGVGIDIKIEYGDLDGRTYTSKMPLKILVREGFGGSAWENPS